MPDCKSLIVLTPPCPDPTMHFQDAVRAQTKGSSGYQPFSGCGILMGNAGVTQLPEARPMQQGGFMKKWTVGACAALAWFCSLNAVAQADASPAKSLDEIKSCMDANLVNRGALRDLSVQVTDREGKAHALRLKLYWKPSDKGEARVNLRLLEPLAMKGSSYLLLQQGRQEKVWFHLPAADRSLHVTGKNMSEPLWGTDFSYGEIKQVLGLLYAGNTVLKGTGTTGGRETYVLETTTDPDASGYRRVVSQIDRKTCVLLQSDFYAKADAPLKQLEADTASLLTLEGYSVVLGYTMRNLQERTQTKVELSDFTLEERLPERMFDPDRFFEPFE